MQDLYHQQYLDLGLGQLYTIRILRNPHGLASLIVQIPTQNPESPLAIPKPLNFNPAAQNHYP